MPNYRGGAKRVDNLGKVRAFRREQTDVERKLWQRLRSGQLAGYTFRRQHEFSGYVLDFYCVAAHLVIELDGGQHYSDEGLKRDAERTAFLEANGLRVLRFTNTSVNRELDAVLEEILRVLTS